MGKIYYGGRGCGKTTKMLLQADALTDEGLTPRFWCRNHEQINILKYNADKLHIDSSKWDFVLYSELPRSRKCEGYRNFIDELPDFLNYIFGENSSYAALSISDCRDINSIQNNKGNE